MKQDLSGVEVPRLVKKPGAHKRVETLDDLKAALAEGWVLRLEPPAPEADLASVMTEDLERQDAERDAAAPVGDEPADEVDAEKPHKGGKKK